MIQVRWSLEAAEDLERIFTHINAESPTRRSEW